MFGCRWKALLFLIVIVACLAPAQARAQIEIEELSQPYAGKWVVTKNDDQYEAGMTCGGSPYSAPGIFMLEPPVLGEYKVTGLDPAGYYLVSLSEDPIFSNGGPENLWYGGCAGFDSEDFTDGEAIILIRPGFGTFGTGVIPTDGQYSTTIEIGVIAFF